MKNKLLWILISVYTLIFVALYSFYHKIENLSQIMDILYLFFPLLSVIMLIGLCKNYGWKSINGKAFYLWAVGMSCWFLGEILWIVFDSFLYLLTYPSVVDIIFLLAYPLIIVGAIMLMLNVPIQWSGAKLVSFVLPLVAIVMISSLWLIPYNYDSQNSLFENVIGVSYVVGGLILIVVVFLLLVLTQNFGKGKMAWPWLIIFIGFILTFVGDVFYIRFFDLYDEAIGYWRLLDLLWISSYLAFAYGFYKIIRISEMYLEKIKKMK